MGEDLVGVSIVTAKRDWRSARARDRAALEVAEGLVKVRFKRVLGGFDLSEITALSRNPGYFYIVFHSSGCGSIEAAPRFIGEITGTPRRSDGVRNRAALSGHVISS